MVRTRGLDALDVQAAGANAIMTLGEELAVNKGTDVTVTIRFKSPDKNNNGDKPVVDHIDLIVGDVTGKTAPTDPNYKSETNPSTKMVATFTSKEWKTDAEGYTTMTYMLSNV